jgi:hypothetical protein
MKIYIWHKFQKWAYLTKKERFGIECYGPFKSVKGAKLALEYQQRVNSNTGQYFNSVKIIKRKSEPEFRTLTWTEICQSGNRHLMEDKKDWHLI